MVDLEVLPPRDNYGDECVFTDNPSLPSYVTELPDYLAGCKCDNHHAVCKSCRFKITIGPEGVEYGHARAVNRGSYRNPRGDCKHRQNSKVDPDRSKPQVHGGKKGGAD